MTGASPSVLHLLNVGLRITEALALVVSSRDSEVLRLSKFPNLILRVCGLSLAVVLTGASMFGVVDLLNVLRVCGHSLVVVLTGASTSGIVCLLTVGLGSIKSLDCVESSYNSDLLFLSVPNFVLRFSGISRAVVLTGASTSDVVHLLAYLNVGLGSGTKWLDPVESSYNSDLLFLSAPNLILRFSGISLAVVLTGASTSDVVPLLNVSLGSIKSLDPVESSNNCDLLLSSFRNLILRVSGLSLIVREKGNGLWCVILEVNCEGEVFLWKLEESEFRTVSKL